MGQLQPSAGIATIGRKTTTIRYPEQTIDSLPRFLKLLAEHRKRVGDELGSIPLVPRTTR